MKNFCLIICALLASTLAHSEVRMPKIFSDGMILQQGVPVRVWGAASAGSEIEIRFKGGVRKTTADASGKWSVKLAPMKADKSSAEMEIFENGKPALKISNAVVGEVWMTGGQSNMEMTIKATSDKKRLEAEADYPLIRYFSQPRTVTAETPQEDFHPDSKWIVCTNENIKADNFNATAFYFAEALLKDLDVPVGIISSAHGGTPMRAWADLETVSKSAYFKEVWEDFQKRKAEYDYEAALAKVEKTRKDFEEKVAKAKTEGKKRPSTPFTLSELHKPWPDTPDGFKTPALLFNGKVAPAAGYGIRGFLWYQGEADGGAPSCETFGKQFEGLIASWRGAWGGEQLPFIFAQLPSYGQNADSWPSVRLQQTAVFMDDKNVGMAVLIDSGEEKDIHPKDKTTVGKRMELIALKMAYGHKLNAYGPFFKKAVFKGNKAELSFEMDSRTLKPVDSPTGFETMDSSGDWKPASAVVGKDAITVSSADGSPVKAVRYLHAAWARPLVSVYNDNNLPLAPFWAGKFGE